MYCNYSMAHLIKESLSKENLHSKMVSESILDPLNELPHHIIYTRQAQKVYNSWYMTIYQPLATAIGRFISWILKCILAWWVAGRGLHGSASWFYYFWWLSPCLPSLVMTLLVYVGSNPTFRVTFRWKTWVHSNIFWALRLVQSASSIAISQRKHAMIPF